jgi:hypothetical protein
MLQREKNRSLQVMASSSGRNWSGFGSRHFNLICSRRLFGTAAAGAPHQIAAAPIISLAVSIDPFKWRPAATHKKVFGRLAADPVSSDLYPPIGARHSAAGCIRISGPPISTLVHLSRISSPVHRQIASLVYLMTTLPADKWITSSILLIHLSIERTRDRH